MFAGSNAAAVAVRIISAIAAAITLVSSNSRAAIIITMRAGRGPLAPLQ